MNKHMSFLTTAFVTGALSFAISGCGSSSSGGSSAGTSAGLLPLITPIVKAAIPTGLGGTASHATGLVAADGLLSTKIFHAFDENDNGSGNATQLSEDIAALQSRFFSSAGPTEIVPMLLPQLDSLITGINTMASSSTSSCLSQTPVNFQITPAGQTVQMYAQCYTSSTPQYAAVSSGYGTVGMTSTHLSYAADPGIIQFGIKNGITYIFSAVGVEWVAAIVTPVGTGYTVTSYIGIGYSNQTTTESSSNPHGGNWDSGSYGLIEIQADSNTGTFELATAGVGLGYCGAQLISDGTNVYAEVSGDMGTSCVNGGSGPGGTSSTVTDDLCVLASNVTTASTSCTTGASNFTLTPIGRIGTGSYFSSNSVSAGGQEGASTYPATPNLVINGTSTDGIHFAPATLPSTGVGQLTSGGSGGGSGQQPTAAQLGAAINSACPSITVNNATSAATAGLAVYTSQGQNAAISAINSSLNGNGYNSTQQTCADTAVENYNG